VREALIALPGVASVDIQGTKKAVVKVDSAKFKEEDAQAALAKAGYKESTMQKTL
jgi:copper chaperone CopZ